jgi:hypothetical protein
MEDDYTPVPSVDLATLAPPLRGGPWMAIYDPSMARGHRRVYIDGNIPGRFAVDFMKVDAEGKMFHGDEQQVANWYGYGADVLAVADGVITDVRDSVAESATLSATKHPLAEASGNYIALSLGHDRYAFYEHLQPGSIRVKKGDRVRAGQVIAKLGYSGDSTGPHLHFHVADHNSDLAAEGLPFVFASFRENGQTRKSEFPAASAVIEFP